MSNGAELKEITMSGNVMGGLFLNEVEQVFTNNSDQKEFPLFSEKCHFTDDTVMTVAVADAILNGATPDDYIESFNRLDNIFSGAGYGGGFRKWLPKTL